jgi:glutathione-independent formaldehyde dehydrogenase
LLGAAIVIVVDSNKQRLQQARSFGCKTVDVTSEVSLLDQIKVHTGGTEVDIAVDCVGFEAHGCGHNHGKETPAQVLNDCMTVARAGGSVGIPGLYVTVDPGSKDAAAQEGSLSLRLGLGWAKSMSFHTGQAPVLRYHKELMHAILNDKIQIADAVNVQVVSLDDAPAAYADFDQGAAKKYVFDPHNMTGLL